MPDWKRYVREHLPPLAASPQRENEIVTELSLQLEQAYQDAMAGGAGEAEAFEQARRQFHDWEALAREIDTADRTPGPLGRRAGLLSGLPRDLRYAARLLRRSPAFTAIAVATLAFGIGGNTAIFTMVDRVALRSLPYPEPGRLMAIETRKEHQPELEAWASAADFFDIRDRARSFSAMAAISPVWSVIMTGRGDAERLQCLYVSADFFPMLGTSAALGRTFLPSEDLRSKPSNVVVLSHAFWVRRFGGAPEIIGQTLALDGAAYTVVGVLPASFRYPGEPLAGSAAEIDAWMPLAANPIVGSVRAVRFLKLIGRLGPGVPVERARDEVRRIGSALAAQYPDMNRGFVDDVQPLSRQVTGRSYTPMMLLLGAVGFVLLMACANVANLLLTRASTRLRELSVRVALGASRWRILRQMLAEGFLMSLAGGAAGVLVALGGLRVLSVVAPPSLVHPGEIALDPRALLFTGVAVLGCALIAGLPPALRIAGGEMESALRDAGRHWTAGHHRLRAVLVALQVAVALVLLVGAGLLIRSFQRVVNVPAGFNPHHLVTISTQMPDSARTPEERTAVYRRMRGQLLAVPGVEKVACVSRLPLMGSNLGSWLFVEGRSVPGEPGFDVEYRVAAPEYFAAMGIPLRAGRLFDDRDNANPGAVLVISESAARKFWGGLSAVGRRVKLGANPERAPWITVVGVVGDVHHIGLDTDPRPEIYRPYPVNPLGAPILVIRTATDPALMLSTLAARVRSVAAGVPAYNVYTMEALVERSTAQRRFVMLLLSGFALAALLLAGVGIYGTVSQSVVQRTRELGVRMALGASPGAALRLVFWHGFRWIAAGIAAGWVSALGLTRLTRGLLFEVQPLDAATFAAAGLVLAGFAMLACYVPARHATRVDPMTALREEW